MRYYVFDFKKRQWFSVEGRKISLPKWKGIELFYHAPLYKSMLSSTSLVLSEARSGGIVAQANTLSELKKNANAIANRYVSNREFISMLKRRAKAFEEENGISPMYNSGFKENPHGQGVEIYDTILEIKARKGANSLWPHENFVHKFSESSRAKIIGNPDGSLTIKSTVGKPLHKKFHYSDDTGTRR